jgi:phosphoenolpyruvate phosphomutase
MHNATKLRAALKKPGAVKVVGAHDALSARLIERAGFDGQWIRHFGLAEVHSRRQFHHIE